MFTTTRQCYLQRQLFALMWSRSSKSLQAPTMLTVLTQIPRSFRIIRSGRMDIRTAHPPPFGIPGLFLASPRALGSSNVGLEKRSSPSNMTEHPRIALAPDVLVGKPVIRGDPTVCRIRDRTDGRLQIAMSISSARGGSKHGADICRRSPANCGGRSGIEITFSRSRNTVSIVRDHDCPVLVDAHPARF